MELAEKKIFSLKAFYVLSSALLFHILKFDFLSLLLIYFYLKEHTELSEIQILFLCLLYITGIFGFLYFFSGNQVLIIEKISIMTILLAAYSMLVKNNCRRTAGFICYSALAYTLALLLTFFLSDKLLKIDYLHDNNTDVMFLLKKNGKRKA